MLDNECNHTFVHRDTVTIAQENGRYSMLWTQTITYFCNKCLLEKEQVKRHSGNTDDHNIPDWCRAAVWVR